MRRGELSVFLCLIIILVVSLLCSVVEISRQHGVRMQIRMAVDAACESQFAAYDRELLRQFKVFFFDGSMGDNNITESEIISGIKSDVNLMLHPSDCILGKYADFYKISLEGGSIDSIALATDDEGMVFRQQALMSMKGRYGIAFAESLLEECNLINRNITDGDNYKKSEDENKQDLQLLQDQKAEIDKEKGDEAKKAAGNQNPAAVVESQKSLGILELVKPEKFNVSQKQMDLSVLPSGRTLNKGNGLSSATDLVSNVLFNEYLMEMFSCALTEDNSIENQISYQIEYLLSGKEHDVDNLNYVIEKLLLIREGANFVYLINDGVKVAEAEAVAALLVGYTGLVPLIKATKYAILFSWAFAESVMDVKRLLAGKKVAIIKDSSNWQLALSNIGNAASDVLTDDNNGITYKHYLRLLLLLSPQKDLAKRCLDLIEMKMRMTEGYDNFRLDVMVCQMAFNMKAYSDSVFYILPFMRKYSWDSRNKYKIKRSYSYELWR